MLGSFEICFAVVDAARHLPLASETPGEQATAPALAVNDIWLLGCVGANDCAAWRNGWTDSSRDGPALRRSISTRSLIIVV